MRDMTYGMHEHGPSTWVLVVDDDEDARVPLATMVRRAGLEVVEAKDGREAFECLLVSDTTPLLMVLDLDMPVMTGWELLQLVRSYARFNELEVLVASGHERPADAIRPDSRTRYLRKPCDPTVVVSHAEALLKRR